MILDNNENIGRIVPLFYHLLKKKKPKLLDVKVILKWILHLKMENTYTTFSQNVEGERVEGLQAAI